MITAGNKSVTANVNDITHNGSLQSNENQTIRYPHCSFDSQFGCCHPIIPLPLHSSLNQMEVRPRQILSLMLRVWSQFLPPKVPSTLAFVLSLGICSGSGRQRLGSHSLVPTKRGIGLVLKMTPIYIVRSNAKTYQPTL